MECFYEKVGRLIQKILLFSFFSSSPEITKKKSIFLDFLIFQNTIVDNTDLINPL